MQAHASHNPQIQNDTGVFLMALPIMFNDDNPDIPLQKSAYRMAQLTPAKPLGGSTDGVPNFAIPSSH